jgi:hypothetical protein
LKTVERLKIESGSSAACTDAAPATLSNTIASAKRRATIENAFMDDPVLDPMERKSGNTDVKDVVPSGQARNRQRGKKLRINQFGF